MSTLHSDAHRIGMAVLAWGGQVDEQERAVTSEYARDAFIDSLGDSTVPVAVETVADALAVAISPLDAAVAVTERATQTLPAPQLFALAQFVMRGLGSERRGDRWFRCSLGGAGLPDDYLHVVMGDGFECGIDPEGRVST